MNVVLKWVKANIFIVVFCAIIIIVPALMWFVAGRMNADVRDEVAKRASLIQDLDRHRRVPFSITNPVKGNQSKSDTVVLNPSLLDRYREVSLIIRADAEQIREDAVALNRKNRSPLVPDLFPSPPAFQRETLPFEMHDSIVRAYEAVLEEIEAGSPPAADEVRENIESARERLTTQVLVGGLSDEGDQAWLAEKLADTRLSQYADTAASLRIYASLDALGVPLESDVPARAEGRGLVALFQWQWHYWIVQDILLALNDANKDSSSILNAPAKHVLSIDVQSSRTRLTGTASGGFGMGPGGRRSADKGSDSAPAVGANPSTEVALNFASSLTGRSSNPLYDVRVVTLEVVVDTAKMPQVFDALAQQNFITILRADVQPVDPFVALKGGYFYGAEPTSYLTLTLETIWFRQWTAQFMPDELKQALGIPVPGAAPAG